jgi:hypothetical protein
MKVILTEILIVDTNLPFYKCRRKVKSSFSLISHLWILSRCSPIMVAVG